ncbi:hypothetical protein ASD86_03600 [Lysobacter sp. Root690]|nr:hypothetical protein ASD86_03600 [Lysobacter sp. Root690]
MPEPNPPRSRRFDRRLIVWIVAAIAVSVAIAMASTATTGKFLPSPDILWLKLLLNTVAASGAVFAFIALRRRQRALATDTIDPSELIVRFQPSGGSAILSAFVLLALNAMLTGLVPPLLHRLAGPVETSVIEPVRTQTSRMRGCRRMAVLPGDSMLMRRRLCAIPVLLHDEVSDAGRIEIVGSVSYFGIAVRSYRAVPVADTP